MNTSAKTQIHQTAIWIQWSNIHLRSRDDGELYIKLHRKAQIDIGTPKLLRYSTSRPRSHLAGHLVSLLPIIWRMLILRNWGIFLQWWNPFRSFQPGSRLNKANDFPVRPVIADCRIIQMFLMHINIVHGLTFSLTHRTVWLL